LKKTVTIKKVAYNKTINERDFNQETEKVNLGRIKVKKNMQSFNDNIAFNKMRSPTSSPY
jgi:hypothetical protein